MNLDINSNSNINLNKIFDDRSMPSIFLLNEINNIIIFSHDKKISNDMCTKYFRGNEQMCKF